MTIAEIVYSKVAENIPSSDEDSGVLSCYMAKTKADKSNALLQMLLAIDSEFGTSIAIRCYGR